MARRVLDECLKYIYIYTDYIHVYIKIYIYIYGHLWGFLKWGNGKMDGLFRMEKASLQRIIDYPGYCIFHCLGRTN